MEQQQHAFFCQSCRARLVLVRGESDGGYKRPPESWAALNASMFESGKTYESFIMLDDRRPGEQQTSMLRNYMFDQHFCVTFSIRHRRLGCI
jgi:hypothetical protein